MPGKFVIKKGTTGKFRFVLLSPRGQVIATSEAYGAKASAMAGIRSMRKLAPEATIEDLTRAGESKRKVSPKASTPASPKPARRIRARPAPIPTSDAGGARRPGGAGRAVARAASEASANALGDTETAPLRLCPHYAQARALWPGQPLPLGAHFDGAGTNFSVFSDVAERVELCLFDDVGAETRVRLPDRSGSRWHGYPPRIPPGQR